VAGMIYSANVSRRMRAQHSYAPVAEDWIFHVALPVGAYGLLAIGAYGTISSAHVAMFLIGAAALVLLFIGIHNAWDTVVYNVFVQRREKSEEQSARAKEGSQSDAGVRQEE
jgi:phosphotransferase system  glucose/maltose/N-acetylglucosamine-specific IIC component